MGSIQAMEWADRVDQGAVPLADAVRMHLQGNFYPPINPAWHQPVIDLVTKLKAATKIDWDEKIKNPLHTQGADVNEFITVGSIVEDLHLDFFLPRTDQLDKDAEEPDDNEVDARSAVAMEAHAITDSGMLLWIENHLSEVFKREHRARPYTITWFDQEGNAHHTSGTTFREALKLAIMNVKDVS